MKVRNRLFLTAVVLLSIGMYRLVDWIVEDVRLHYFLTMEEAMVDASVLVAAQLGRQVEEGMLSLDPEFVQAIDEASEQEISAEIYNHTKTNMNLRVIVCGTDQQVLFDSRGDLAVGDPYRWRDARLSLQGEYGARATYEMEGDPDSFHFYVGAPILVNGEIIGTVSVGKPVSSITPFMNQARKRLIISGIIGFAAILLLMIPVSLWIIQPIRALTNYARHIRDGRIIERPVLGHGGEMSELADAFEEMRDALEGKQYVEEYVQSLTHEMKSPLAAIQGAAELLDEEMPEEQRRRFLSNIRSESQRLHGLVDRMLSLAAIEKRKDLTGAQMIDIQVLLDDVTDSMLPVMKAKGITVRSIIDDDAKLFGEYFLLRQAVANLIQNAVDFSPEGGEVHVAVESQEESTRIRVSDRGNGLPEYALDKVFDRFYSLPRPDGRSKSSGLGLNFVREIARLHGGDISLANAPDGGAVAVLEVCA